MERYFWLWIFFSAMTFYGFITGQLSVETPFLKIEKPAVQLLVSFIFWPVINAIILIMIVFYSLTGKTTLRFKK